VHVNRSALETILVSSDGSSSPIVIKAIQIAACGVSLTVERELWCEEKVEPRSCWGHDRLDWVFAPLGKIRFDQIE